MSLILTTAPAVEPATLAEAKAHLRVDGTAEDAYIQSLIVTSRLHIEAALGLALITQSWLWTIDVWPEHLGAGTPLRRLSVLQGISRRDIDAGVALPMRPVQTINSTKLTAIDGTQTVLDPRRYLLDGTSHPARLLPQTLPFPLPGQPAQGIQIAFTAGFGPAESEVPANIRLALLQLIAHWFENREPIETGGRGAGAVQIPDTVSDLLAPFRGIRL